MLLGKLYQRLLCLVLGVQFLELTKLVFLCFNQCNLISLLPFPIFQGYYKITLINLN